MLYGIYGENPSDFMEIKIRIGIFEDWYITLA
jgi:hypothetical protein